MSFWPNVQDAQVGAIWTPFTERTDVLPQDLVKSRNREIHIYTFSIALKFDRHLGSGAAEMPAKFQKDIIIITPNRADSRIHEILR